MGYQPVENYGIIGDMDTVALVGMDGSIDFLCLPEFDSPSVFAALLDDRAGGRFLVAPLLDGVSRKQLYLPDTCVLLTRFLSDAGVAEVSDFMPIAEAAHNHQVVRRAKTVRGELDFRMVCQPRFDYARGAHTAERTRDGALFISTGNHPIALRLRASVPDRGQQPALGPAQWAPRARPGRGAGRLHPRSARRRLATTGSTTKRAAWLALPNGA